MKVLFVSEYFPPEIRGGGEINVNVLARALAARGIDVSVVTSHFSNLARFEEREGVKIHRVLKTGADPKNPQDNLKRTLFFVPSVVQEVLNLAKKEQYSIIHFIGASIGAAKKLRHLQIPLVATIESYPALCPKGDKRLNGSEECKKICSPSLFTTCQARSAEIGKMKNKWFLRYNPLALGYVYKHFQKLRESLAYCNLIAISEYIQTILKQHGHNSFVIPNAIDIDAFRAASKQHEDDERSNTSDEEREKQSEEAEQVYKKPNILYLGSLIKSKGPQVLLKAIRELEREGQSYHVDLYGTGNLKEELEEFIHSHKLDATIHEPISYDGIPEVYARAEVVVFPSLWPEPFGRISIEAMATGKGVIGSAIGGIKETIKEGTGILVTPGDEDELREAISHVLKDRGLQEKMKVKGRVLAQEYSEEKVVTKLIKFYQNLASPPLH